MRHLLIMMLMFFSMMVSAQDDVTTEVSSQSLRNTNRTIQYTLEDNNTNGIRYLYQHGIVGERNEEFKLLVCTADVDSSNDPQFGTFDAIKLQIVRGGSNGEPVGEYIGRHFSPDCVSYKIWDGDTIFVEMDDEQDEVVVDVFLILMPPEAEDDEWFENLELNLEEPNSRIIGEINDSVEIEIYRNFVGILLIANTVEENDIDLGISSIIKQVGDVISDNGEIDVDIIDPDYEIFEFSLGRADINNSTIFLLREHEGTIQLDMTLLSDSDIVMIWFPEPHPSEEIQSEDTEESE